MTTGIEKDEKQPVKKVATRTKSAAPKKEQKNNEPLANKRIYVGPGRPGLLTNAVYDGEYPIYVQEALEECPAIEKLMVPIHQYQSKKKAAKEKGTIEYKWAQEVFEYFQKDDKEEGES